MANGIKRGTKKTQSTFSPLEHICIWGTIFLYSILLLSLLIVTIMYWEPSSNCKNLFELFWNSLFSVISGTIAIIDLIAVVLFIKYKKNCSKKTVISFGIFTYIIIIFDDMAIKAPFSASLIALVNLIALIACVLFILSNKLCHEECNDINDNKNIALRTALQGTENKKIIAIQMYKVKTDIIRNNNVEKVIITARSSEHFIREGYDINGVSSIIYELDRGIVDNFYIFLHSYKEFLTTGSETVKEHLINSLDCQITDLHSILKTIETTPRVVTKEDCCIARILVIYLSFKQILTPNPNPTYIPANYIGELSFSDGALNLTPETENKLFTLVRTGVLGAVLLGENTRHIFNYRKDGIKQGRKYCASVVRTNDATETNNSEKQSMDVCLFTVEDDKNAIIPGYVFDSINKREEQIKKALNKIKQGDGIDG